MAANSHMRAHPAKFSFLFAPRRTCFASLLRSAVGPLLLSSVMAVSGMAFAGTRKDVKQSPNALQVVLPSPMKDVVDAMQEVAGDQVIYGKYSGTPYQVGADELIIIKASDILAKIG